MNHKFFVEIELDDQQVADLLTSDDPECGIMPRMAIAVQGQILDHFLAHGTPTGSEVVAQALRAVARRLKRLNFRLNMDQLGYVSCFCGKWVKAEDYRSAAYLEHERTELHHKRLVARERNYDDYIQHMLEETP